MGGFETGPMLVPTHPLLLHNAGERFSTHGIQAAYRSANANSKLSVHANQLGDGDIAGWLAQLK
jgi:hypothetical protein